MQVYKSIEISDTSNLLPIYGQFDPVVVPNGTAVYDYIASYGFYSLHHSLFAFSFNLTFAVESGLPDATNFELDGLPYMPASDRNAQPIYVQVNKAVGFSPAYDRIDGVIFTNTSRIRLNIGPKDNTLHTWIKNNELSGISSYLHISGMYKTSNP